MTELEFEDCGSVEIDYIKKWIWVSDLALCSVEEVDQVIKDLKMAKNKIGW